MCGRTASTRPPNVLVRVTGAQRYVAAPSTWRPNPAQQQRRLQQQRGRQPRGQQRQAPAAAAAEEQNDEEEKIEAEERPETVRDAYRPSHNAGPHFYLPVLRYVTGTEEEEEKLQEEERAIAGITTGSAKRGGSKRKAAAVEAVTTQDEPREKQELAREEDFTTDHRDDLPPSSPTSSVQPSALSPPAVPGTPELVLQSMRWGLIPHWTEAADIASADASYPYSMINARAESVDQTKSYRQLLRRRRCVTVVDGYFEWQAATVNGKVKKQPYCFRPNHITPPLPSSPSDPLPSASLQPLPGRYDRLSDDKPFLLLASLFDTWRDPSTGVLLYTVTILTTSASQKLGWCHERQPVVLSHVNAVRWLQWWRYAFADCKDSVVVPNAAGVEWYKVPEIVGSVRNQGSECTQALEEYIAERKAAGIGKFFAAAPAPSKQTAGGEPDSIKSDKPLEVAAHKQRDEHDERTTKAQDVLDLTATPDKKRKLTASDRRAAMSPASPASKGKKGGEGGGASGGGSGVKAERDASQLSLTAFFDKKK